MAPTGPGRNRPSKKPSNEIPASLIDAVGRRLARNARVRRTILGAGRLHVDRQLPFLCVYRRPPKSEDAGTSLLVKGEAAYLLAPGEAKYRQAVSRLVHRVVETLSAEFGAFLIVEVWAAPNGGKANDPAVPSVLPTFTVHAPAEAAMARTVGTLETRLRRIKILKQGVEVEIVRDGQGHPPTMRPLLTASQARALNCHFLGIAVPPVYRKEDSAEVFPLLSRSLRRGLSLALRHSWFEFSRSLTTHRPPHYHALGRRAVVKAVWEIDRQLADLDNRFDYLLLVTPVNADGAWRQFQRGRFETAPVFHYRALPVDPTLLKRELFKVPIERVEDPALQLLFQEKQEELELTLTMLQDRDTPRFLYESLQLFGGVSDELMGLARDLVGRFADDRSIDQRPPLDAAAFAQRAEAECAFYRKNCDDFRGTVLVTSDVSGLLVSHGRLLVNSDLRVPASRVEPLIAHEVGTHMVTFFNGRMQPFQQLYSGLAGYEELQEGLAVLAEYLAGGLSRTRLRQIAGRVIAVRQLVDGASFVDAFRLLNRDHGFNQNVAYNIVMRVFRGGGLTKDAVYLRGLQAILRYIQKGGDLESLFVGKMAVAHVPIIKELQYRGVLKPAHVLPRYLHEPDVGRRLQRLRASGAGVLELVGDSTSSPGATR